MLAGLLARWRSRRASEDRHTEFLLTPDTLPGLQAEYQDLLDAELRRWGICAPCATLEVRHLGEGARGLAVFVAVVSLNAWERTPALRLLLGLPLLDRRIRQTIGTRWLADVSEFGGLWLAASEQVQRAPAMGELRELLVALTGPAAGDTRPPAQDDDATDAGTYT